MLSQTSKTDDRESHQSDIYACNTLIEAADHEERVFGAEGFPENADTKRVRAILEHSLGNVGARPGWTGNDLDTMFAMSRAQMLVHDGEVLVGRDDRRPEDPPLIARALRLAIQRLRVYEMV